jgi:hypothetical protein
VGGNVAREPRTRPAQVPPICVMGELVNWNPGSASMNGTA